MAKLAISRSDHFCVVWASHGYPGYFSHLLSRTLLGLARLAAASPVFYPLASLVKARLVIGLTVAFGPGPDPGQHRSVRATDAGV